MLLISFNHKFCVCLFFFVVVFFLSSHPLSHLHYHFHRSVSVYRRAKGVAWTLTHIWSKCTRAYKQYTVCKHIGKQTEEIDGNILIKNPTWNFDKFELDPLPFAFLFICFVRSTIRTKTLFLRKTEWQGTKDEGKVRKAENICMITMSVWNQFY